MSDPGPRALFRCPIAVLYREEPHTVVDTGAFLGPDDVDPGEAWRGTGNDPDEAIASAYAVVERESSLTDPRTRRQFAPADDSDIVYECAACGKTRRAFGRSPSHELFSLAERGTYEGEPLCPHCACEKCGEDVKESDHLCEQCISDANTAKPVNDNEAGREAV